MASAANPPGAASSAAAAPPPATDKKVIHALDLLRRGLELRKGKTLQEVGIGLEWMESYATVALRSDRDRRYGITRFPYEPGAAIIAFAGGFFDHPDWPLRRALEKQGSMKAIADYKCKYVNATGYWLTFHNAVADLHIENLAKDPAGAHRFGAWGYMAVQYALRCLGLRTEFYKLAGKDPTYARFVLPALEKRGEQAAADDLDAPLADLDSHMSSQLMKAVAILAASNL